MAEKIDYYEDSDLPENQKVALRLTDAFVNSPGAISAKLREEVRHYFTEAQIVELMLDMSKWSTQKLSVALGTDEPIDSERLSLFDFDDGGGVVWGPTLKAPFIPSEQPSP